jgi:beta-lactam-binding protein with PASTA domain
MGFVKTGASALGKLLMMAMLAAAFVVGMVGVVWLSLRGEEIKVPEIVGKDFNESEKELAALGLKIKRRSYRYSEEKANTVIEQAPKAGDTVKTGHQILVVVAQANPEGTEAPAPLKKDDKDDVESLDSNTDKPKTTNKNANVKKPEKTRDVISNKANKNANTGNSNGNSGNSNSKSNSNNSDNKNSTTPATNKTPNPATPGKTPQPKPNEKPPAAGDTRNRRTP